MKIFEIVLAICCVLFVATVIVARIISKKKGRGCDCGCSDCSACHCCEQKDKKVK